MIKVKICGITNFEDAESASVCGADAIGLIFSKKSPRYINKKTAKKIIGGLDPFLTKVGVFIDEEREKVMDTASCLGLDALQFHGKESPSYCRYFKNKFRVIKAFFPEDRPFEETLLSYEIDAFLFDIRYEEKKAKGKKTLSESILKEISALADRGRKVIISGGLGVDNIYKIKKYKPYAVDICSGIEEIVGRKDKRLMNTFIRKVKYETA